MGARTVTASGVKFAFMAFSCRPDACTSATGELHQASHRTSWQQLDGLRAWLGVEDGVVKWQECTTPTGPEWKVERVWDSGSRQSRRGNGVPAACCACCSCSRWVAMIQAGRLACMMSTGCRGIGGRGGWAYADGCAERSQVRSGFDDVEKSGRARRELGACAQHGHVHVGVHVGVHVTVAVAAALGCHGGRGEDGCAGKCRDHH